MVFTKRYFVFAVVLFVTECLIAFFVHDAFVRPYAGDFLVVILIYCTVKAFFLLPPRVVALGTILFSYTLETLQYFHIVDRLGLAGNAVARTVIGYGFDWLDVLMYTLGIVTVLLLERRAQETGLEKKRCNMAKEG